MIRHLCVIAVLALWLTAWLPLYVAQPQPPIEQLGTTQLSRLTESPIWLIESLQAEIVPNNDDLTVGSATIVKQPAAPAKFVFLAHHFKHPLAQRAPRCQMCRFGSAIWPERAPPFADA